MSFTLTLSPSHFQLTDKRSTGSRRQQLSAFTGNLPPTSREFPISLLDMTSADFEIEHQAVAEDDEEEAPQSPAKDAVAVRRPDDRPLAPHAEGTNGHYARPALSRGESRK